MDDFDLLLDEVCSLKELWYWREVVQEAFTRSIKDSPNQPLHCVSFLRVYSSFIENAGAWTPEEQTEIGPQLVLMVESACKEIADRIGAVLHEVAKHYVIYDFQYAEEHAAYPLILEKTDPKHQKDLVAPVQPGSESQWSNMQDLEKYKKNSPGSYFFFIFKIKSFTINISFFSFFSFLSLHSSFLFC